MSKSTLTTKQIKAKLSSLLYAFDGGELAYELLEGYMESDAEDTDLEPYVKTAKTAIENLINKLDDMCVQYGMEDYLASDECITEEDNRDQTEQLSFDFDPEN
jgi:hypothetical protein